jgi:hypothetical protein
MQENQDRTYVYDEIYQDPDIAIVKFPFSSQNVQRQRISGGSTEQGKGSGTMGTGSKGEPICDPVTVDFEKAADGRTLTGGIFVETEWKQGFEIKIEALDLEGKKDLHPMIFDSLNVESNGIGSNNVFFLGSPNFECGGMGVGRGGREGMPGENCEPLGNLLIPSRKTAHKKDNDNEAVPGGILVFEFKKYTEVRTIGLLNVAVNSTILVSHSDGRNETIGVNSVGKNGYQIVNVSKVDVGTLYVYLESFVGMDSLELCMGKDDKKTENEVDQISATAEPTDDKEEDKTKDENDKNEDSTNEKGNDKNEDQNEVVKDEETEGKDEGKDDT